MKITRSRERPVMVQREMLDNAGLNFFEKGLCAYLDLLAEDGHSEMPLEALAYLGDCSVEVMTDIVQKLKKKGYIQEV